MLIGAGLTLLATLITKILFWPFVGLCIWIAAFFRDPVRTTPQGDDLIVAPADGLVTMIQRVPIPRELVGELGEAPLVRVSIFMSVFDVHINRTPIAGVIRQVVYISGKFLNADLDKASDENERQHFVVEGARWPQDRLYPDCRLGRAPHRRFRQAGRHGRRRSARRPHPLRQPASTSICPMTSRRRCAWASVRWQVRPCLAVLAAGR
ncbi:phosphatidylserine decarboxylase [Sphingomonas paucimobilis]|nr:phosphatidylserine decarboxylase [Sphingomonas paucimobilis]